ncbi:MAG: sulfur carrier protein ThiS [Candidatus Aminicenantes bacterium]|jgi:thiamine biosynthesis protein ThiS
MNITVNGKIKEINDCKNIEQLVSSLFEKNEGIIVELNEGIIKRDHWEEQPLQEGDSLQLIQFIGGG